MSIIAQSTQPAPPRNISRADYGRSYVLYDVASNIPVWGSAGEPGAWNYARGVLVETSRTLRGIPVAVHYQELLTRHRHDPASAPAHLPVGHEITVVVNDAAGHLVTVVSRRETAPYGEHGDTWRLTVDGIEPDGGVHRHPPSLPWMANLIRHHLDQQRPPAPVITERTEPP